MTDGNSQPHATAAIGELIAAEMTMAYPQLAESRAQTLPF
jgi:hypothetical protein